MANKEHKYSVIFLFPSPLPTIMGKINKVGTGRDTDLISNTLLVEGLKFLMDIFGPRHEVVHVVFMHCLHQGTAIDGGGHAAALLGRLPFTLQYCLDPAAIILQHLLHRHLSTWQGCCDELPQFAECCAIPLGDKL